MDNTNTTANADFQPPEKSYTKKKTGVVELRQLKKWHSQAVWADAKWRDRAEEDARFYAGDHWTPAERQVLRDRAQAPIVFNRIQRDVLIQVGRQIQNRMQPLAKPRGHADVEMATAITDVIRYVMDANHFEYELTAAVTDQVIGPWGWLFCGYQSDELTAEPIRVQHVPWREMRIDPRSKRLDLSDAKYIFRERWVDVDDAKSFFPDKANELNRFVNQQEEATMSPRNEYYTGDAYAEAAMNDDPAPVSYVQENRQMVKLVECWFQETQMTNALRYQDGRVVLLEDVDPSEVIQVIGQNNGDVVRGPHKRIYYVIFCGDVILAQGKSPYLHNRYPYVCVQAFRAPISKPSEILEPLEPYGIVRSAKDPQRVINHTQSKIRHILNTRNVVMSRGVAERDEVEQAASDPAGVIELNGDGRFEFVDQLNQASFLMRLLPVAEDQLQAGTGVNEASRGAGPEASGRALFARQQQSETNMAALGDHQRLAIQMIGEMILSMVQQSYRGEKVFRITEQMGDRLVAVNVANEERAYELMQKGVTVYGDVSQNVYDVVVDVTPAAMRVEADQELMLRLVQQLGPQTLLSIADLLVENTDLRNKKQIMDRISAVQQAIMPGVREKSMPESAVRQQDAMGMPVEEQQQPGQEFVEQTQQAEQQASASLEQQIMQAMAQQQGLPTAPMAQGVMQ